MTDVPSTSAGQSVGGTATKSSSEDKAARRGARDAERKRRRRAEDAQLREREAAERRQRRAAAPDSAALKRKRRQEDPDFRKREAECKRRRREADPDAARERKRAEVAAWRGKQYATPNARFPIHSLFTLPTKKPSCSKHGFSGSTIESAAMDAADTSEYPLDPDDGSWFTATRRHKPKTATNSAPESLPAKNEVTPRLPTVPVDDFKVIFRPRGGH
ncbi:hypothetical protein HPB51_023956 [Rhipicephalus microplus]|uniref:Uncharacterized protein n=1 Tax=Rhipicephalus microplus TaxID=6941 RepID=A0A9J6EVD6_RHIMP|nr:hypothetical protein HPB51_023956 [Rhipicephalus microplus]